MHRDPRGPAIRRSPLAAALGLALLLGWSPVRAETTGTTAPGPDARGADAAYNPFAAFGLPPESEAAGAEPYRDRIIAASDLAELPPDEDDEALADGPQRAAHVEVIANRSRFAGERDTEFGVAFGGYLETSDYGVLSGEARVFRSDRERERYGGSRWHGSASLWQRGLPMPGGWLVNNGLGVLNSTTSELLRDQYRFFLPSVPLFGASTEWNQRERGLAWHASLGRGGTFNGSLINGFETGDGGVASAGVQWDWSERWTGTVSALLTDGRIIPDDRGLPSFQNGRTQAVVFGNRWQGERDKVNLWLQASDSDAGGAGGLWVDARADRGRYTHRYGAFYLQPDLAWGAWPINDDIRGAYYRLDYRRARWSWNASLDRIDSISGDGFDGWYGNGFVRFQASPRIGYGGGLSARQSGRGEDQTRAEALQLFLDTRWDGGLTRLQGDLAHDDRGADSWQLLADHALDLREGWRLSLSAGYGELANGDLQATPTLTLATYGGFDLTDTLSLDGNVRWTRERGDRNVHGLDISLAMRWQIAARWSLLGTVTENRGNRQSPFVLDPLTNLPLFDALPNDRAVYLSLRYDFNAGRARPVLGGAPGAATGTLAGSVFLDENGDGTRAASEQPAANLTVLLDGRFIARTDDQGRFRFERVAVGAHVVEVLPDNLPLPWALDEDQARRTVTVQVRGTTTVDLGATRPN